MATTRVKAGEEFLGVGLYGPLRIGPSGDFDVKAGRELVAESVKAILSTTARFKYKNFFMAGERFMRDDFGSTSKTLRHENIDDNLKSLAESIYVDAIEKYEPRVDITNVSSQVNETTQSLTTKIEMVLKDSNQALNVVVIRDSKGQINFKSLEGA